MGKVVLVLGAGASRSMGFPTGAELREQILFVNNDYQLCQNICAAANVSIDELNGFVNTFKRSQMYSIDAFLARNGKYTNIGKNVLAAILLRCENIETIRNGGFHPKDNGGAHPKDDGFDGWYRYLFNVATVHKWEELSFDGLEVVTFNYDRSLEVFIIDAMKHSYEKTEEQCLEKLSSLKIVHVYGDLGSLDSKKGPDEFVPYGMASGVEQIKIAARRLKVIPEGRDNDPGLNDAKDMLRNAEAIAFLGFGFDKTNLERLDSRNTCHVMAKHPDNSNYQRMIYATCMGMSRAEISNAFSLTCGNNYGVPFDRYYIDGNCIKVLRESLILDKLYS